MRRITRPSPEPMNVFATCVADIGDNDLRNRFNAITDAVRAEAELYEERARSSQLYRFEAFRGRDGNMVVGNVSKGEFKALYSEHMVKGDDGRSIYEAILALAAGKLCPQCGFGHVKNLDHYLPKAKYPLFAVLPGNLVPSCRDCNMDKLAAIGQTAGAQIIHPYYDAVHFFEDQWLFARIEETTPPTAVFFTCPPAEWDDISKERVQAHFSGFNLSDRFSVQVSTELAAISNYLRVLTDAEARRQHLVDKAHSYATLHTNSWQTALTQALAGCDWYCREGFAA